MDGTTIIKRYSQLESQRKSLDSVLQDIDRYVVPYRGEFFNDLSTEHSVRWHRTRIYDSTAIVACNLLASQMHGNLTPPAAPDIAETFGEDAKDALAAVGGRNLDRVAQAFGLKDAADYVAFSDEIDEYEQTGKRRGEGGAA